MLYVLWRRNPTDGVDYGAMAEVFTGALLGWVAVAFGFLVGWLLDEAAMLEAARRPPPAPPAAARAATRPAWPRGSAWPWPCSGAGCARSARRRRRRWANG